MIMTFDGRGHDIGGIAAMLPSQRNLDDGTYLRRVIHHRNLTQRPLQTFPAWRLRDVGDPLP
jgi:hypothetical protein